MLRRMTQLFQACKVTEGAHHSIRSAVLPASLTTFTDNAPSDDTFCIAKRNAIGQPVTQRRSFHSSSPLHIKYSAPENWLKLNDIVYPPTKDGEAERPAEVYHQRAHVKYSHYKMLYLCRMIRGMSIDEAVKQLQFKDRLGAQILIEILEEAREMAVAQHNVEYRSNLWIAEAFPKKAGFIKGMRKHAMGRVGIVHYRYTHMFVKLLEGTPPEHYYQQQLNGHQNKDEYLKKYRCRRLLHIL